MLKKKPVVRKTTTVRKYKEGGKIGAKASASTGGKGTKASVKGGATKQKQSWADTPLTPREIAKGVGKAAVSFAGAPMRLANNMNEAQKKALNTAGKGIGNVTKAVTNTPVVKALKKGKLTELELGKTKMELASLKAKNIADKRKQGKTAQNQKDTDGSKKKETTPVKKKTNKQKEAMGNAVGTLATRKVTGVNTGVKTGEIQKLNLPAKSTPTKSTATGKAKVREVKREIKDARKDNRQNARIDKKVVKLEKRRDKIAGKRK
jgi:hypothetical protein